MSSLRYGAGGLSIVLQISFANLLGCCFCSAKATALANHTASRVVKLVMTQHAVVCRVDFSLEPTQLNTMQIFSNLTISQQRTAVQLDRLSGEIEVH
uniref:Secreted protein n=1 Tax=Plectus sambesii TaxID=2011161 RepID=A0A914UJB9_9BILA